MPRAPFFKSIRFDKISFLRLGPGVATQSRKPDSMGAIFRLTQFTEMRFRRKK